MKNHGIPEDRSAVVLIKRTGPEEKDFFIFQKSDAILSAYSLMGFPWNILMGFKVFPKFIREPVYKLVSKYRYSLFGTNENQAQT